MHIDIDTGGIEFEEQHVSRMPRAVQDVLLSLPCGVA
jgi:hypothetical protein